MKTVGQLKDGMSGLLTGVKISNITGLDRAIERAVSIVVQNANIPESMGRYPLTLYSGVYDYAVPDTIFGGSLIDLRPQGDTRSMEDVVYKKPIDLFDRSKHILPNGYQVTFEYINGIGRMRVAQVKTQLKTIIDTMGQTTGWTVGGDASGLTLDKTVFYQMPAALRFNLAASGSSGYLEKTMTSKTDLTDYVGVGVAFLACDLPDKDAVTSFVLRIGNDSSNYYEVTATQAFLGAFVEDRYDLIAFDLANATETGSVDDTKFDYVRIYVNYNGTAINNIRFGGLWISLPSPHEMLFESAAVFIPSGDTVAKTTITDDNDQIVLQNSAYTILEMESAIQALINTSGGLGSKLYQMLDAQLYGDRTGRVLGLYDKFKADNPSGKIREAGSWYD